MFVDLMLVCIAVGIVAAFFAIGGFIVDRCYVDEE